MSQDERSLFGDEQAYIASKLHVAELERERKRKELMAASRKRRPHYTPGQRSIMIRFWRIKASRTYRNAIRADPAKYAAYCARDRDAHLQWRALNPERYKDIYTRHYLRHRNEKLLYQAAYNRDHKQEIAARRHNPTNRQKDAERHRTARAANPEKHRTQQRTDYAKHHEERKAYHRSYRLANRDAISVKRRAHYAEHREAINERHCLRAKIKRANETPEQRAKRLERQKIYDARHAAKKAAQQQQNQSLDAS